MLCLSQMTAKRGGNPFFQTKNAKRRGGETINWDGTGPSGSLVHGANVKPDYFNKSGSVEIGIRAHLGQRNQAIYFGRPCI